MNLRAEEAREILDAAKAHEYKIQADALENECRTLAAQHNTQPTPTPNTEHVTALAHKLDQLEEHASTLARENESLRQLNQKTQKSLDAYEDAHAAQARDDAAPAAQAAAAAATGARPAAEARVAELELQLARARLAEADQSLAVVVEELHNANNRASMLHATSKVEKLQLEKAEKELAPLEQMLKTAAGLAESYAAQAREVADKVAAAEADKERLAAKALKSEARAGALEARLCELQAATRSHRAASRAYALEARELVS